ncbi:MAG: long-chain fatty acid--CoA ligase [Acidimicrobiales bacterium]
MLSTMQDGSLTITGILRHGLFAHQNSKVVTYTGPRSPARIADFATVGERAARLARALAAIGVGRADRVATFSFNHQEHLEAYFAVPCMGSVLHTLNIRLFPAQLAYVINHAEDKVILLDAILAPVLARVIEQATTVEQLVVIGEGDIDALRKAFSGPITPYEELIGQAPGATMEWPGLDEHEAAAMCYTSGTTGNPRGVVYSHRATWLHALASTSAAISGISQADTVLPIVPMFHVNAWGVPYAAWLSGADLVMPGRFLQAEPLVQMITEHQVTETLGVPSIFNDILRYTDEHPEVDLSCLRFVLVGGSAVPRSMIERAGDRWGVQIVQGWGMTETSPVAAVSFPDRHSGQGHELEDQCKSGRVVPGVEARIVGPDDTEMPRDGEAQGEIEVRGPWITGSYYGEDAPERFHDGWLRTGDVGTLDSRGYLQLTDRIKDMIKSGGEWISSVALENALMGHPAVFEAAVVAIPDERWSERPLACIVLNEGASADPSELRGYLADKVARWWLPEYWAFVPEIPKTSVGKFSKRTIRADHAAGRLAFTTCRAPTTDLAPPVAPVTDLAPPVAPVTDLAPVADPAPAARPGPE